MDFLRGLTLIQRLSIMVGICSLLASSTSQLDVLFGSLIEKMIVAALTITSGMLSIVLVNIGGSVNVVKYGDQSTMVKSVLGMAGVQHLEVNAQANQALATLAVDPAQPKIDASPQAQAAVNRTAASAGNPVPKDT